MAQTNAILHLLLQLSNDPRVIKGEHGNVPSVAPAQGSVIESVFSSKLANQVAYRAQQQPHLNVEMKEDAAMKQKKDAQAMTSAKQRQLDYLRTLRFSSPQGDVNEDTIVRELLFVF